MDETERVLTISTPAHLGDALFNLNFALRLLQANPAALLRFGVQPEYLPELAQHVTREPRLRLVPLDECRSESVDAWIGPYKDKFKHDLTQMEEFYVEFFAHLCQRLRDRHGPLVNPIQTPADVLYHNPRLPAAELYDTAFEVLLINSIGRSNQLAAYRAEDFRRLAGWLRACGLRVVTTEKLDDLPCTRDWHYNLLQVGRLASTVRYVIGVNTAPLVACLNTLALPTVQRWLILDQRFGYSFPGCTMLQGPAECLDYLQAHGLPHQTIPVQVFEGKAYPRFITEGNHARFILPVAQEVCRGQGLDVGGGKAHWSFPGARTVDPALNPEYHALHLPPCPDAPGWDYIFSSHALEHVPNYVQALEHWRDRLRPGGVVFLYLPHPACTYWWPWKQPTRRHLHRFTPELIQECLTGLGWTGVQVSGQDLAYSFAAYGVKAV